MNLIRALLGGYSSRRLYRYQRQVQRIQKLEPGLKAATDGELQRRSQGLRQRAQNGEPPEALLAEAFALAREASWRTLGMRHFDVQLCGGMALHEGQVAEMKTGEGKTLVATLAAYLDGLHGRGVHIVTVNDYLAARDAQWMGPLYEFLGLSVGVIQEQMSDDPARETELRAAAYGCDVTYGTNHEIAFDYLRDNLALVPEDVVHRGFEFAIVDEVDFLLIDEARTPLIISGEADAAGDRYQRVERVVSKLGEGLHYVVEHKTRRVTLTDAGLEALQQALGVEKLADTEHLELYHAARQSALAHGVYRRDVDYIVEDQRVYIVDEFTGRVSYDKRYSDGLHQALEAKEHVPVRAEDRTVAKVTYQTFYGRYQKLSGMTGTAYSEREELSRTYNLRVVVVPTHQPMVRQDFEELVLNARHDKHAAVLEEILEMRQQGRPVLVGSTSVKESERLSTLLKRRGVEHAVLNAKNHAAEAAVVAQAGRAGAVTISTNMAGRGTDIVLGGKPESPELVQQHEAEREAVCAAGGLHVIGTAHHESVRIDNQLRGRSGRQGDPGSSQFFVCLDDPLYRKFGQHEIGEMRAALAAGGRDDGAPVEDPGVLRTLHGLRKKVEVENEAMRKDVLKYDLVLHVQRETLYGWRQTLVSGEGFDTADLVQQAAEDLLLLHQDHGAIAADFEALFRRPLELPTEGAYDLPGELRRQALESLAELEQRAGAELAYEVGRQILLRSIDELWTDHLSDLERLEEGIGLRGYAQVDPVLEWRRDATEMWDDLLLRIRQRAVGLWFSLELVQQDG